MVKRGNVTFEFNGDSWLNFTREHLVGTLGWMGINAQQGENTIPNIKRAIELIDNILADEYAERCGFKYSEGDFELKESNEHADLFEVAMYMSEERRAENSKALHKSGILRQKEWEELRDLLFGHPNLPDSDCRNWWD